MTTLARQHKLFRIEVSGQTRQHQQDIYGDNTDKSTLVDHKRVYNIVAPNVEVALGYIRYWTKFSNWEGTPSEPTLLSEFQIDNIILDH